MLKYAYNTLVYGREPIARGIERIARYGYDGVEMVGEPDQFDTGKLRQLLDQHGVVASSVVGIYTPARDVVSSAPEVRRAAIDYIRGNIDFAHAVGASVVTVTPSACRKITAEAPLDQEWHWAVAAAKQIAEYAGEQGLYVAVEPWNRYETYLINRMEQSIALVDEVGLPSIGCMADIFHMNIEEESITDAIRAAGSRLVHLHLADNNRAAPGHGHLDFRPIVKALYDIQYSG